MSGTPNFGNLSFKAGRATFTYGQFETVALSFVISALVIHFIIKGHLLSDTSAHLPRTRILPAAGLVSDESGPTR